MVSPAVRIVRVPPLTESPGEVQRAEAPAPAESRSKTGSNDPARSVPVAPPPASNLPASILTRSAPDQLAKIFGIDLSEVAGPEVAVYPEGDVAAMEHPAFGRSRLSQSDIHFLISCLNP